MLVLQIVIRQWDKSQSGELATQARAELADRYPVDRTVTDTIAAGSVVLDRRGDDWLGNRIQPVMLADKLLIDRFCFSINNNEILFKSNLSPNADSAMILWPKQGWLQCHYQWRYRVKQPEAVFWLYESVTVNIAYLTQFDADVFMKTAPHQQALTVG